MLDRTIADISNLHSELTKARAELLTNLSLKAQGHKIWLSEALASLLIAESALRHAEVALSPCSEITEQIWRDPQEVEL